MTAPLRPLLFRSGDWSQGVRIVPLALLTLLAAGTLLWRWPPLSDSPECPEMAAIPPGTFQMGSRDTEAGPFDDEGPVHTVHIAYRLWVSKYPITRAEWKQFVKATGHKDTSNCLTGQGVQDPVVCVSWQDAQDYAAWLTRQSGQHYRLLSEAEYEYAERAGTQSAYFWGPSDARHSQYANNNQKGTTPVGSFKPNAFGLYDMAGNVFSWTQDCYHSSYQGAPTDGSPWGRDKDCERVVRGGSWNYDPRALRSAYRDSWFIDGFDGVGFRVARTPD